MPGEASTKAVIIHLLWLDAEQMSLTSLFRGVLAEYIIISLTVALKSDASRYWVIIAMMSWPNRPWQGRILGVWSGGNLLWASG